ncbi:MAG: methyltransferase domain-containing protein [Halieaceae bacterium]|jgi:SAM-dependent methyltransferase|nr:methyltransferase domain-containing protein [Halieaceae bacterium]
MTANSEQIDYWNGEAGERWASYDDMMSRLLAPIAELLLDHAPPAGARAALDVGCGGGSQSLLLAQRLGAGAKVTGVDISAPLLEVARRRAEQVEAELEFLQADAAAHEFAAGSFDLLFSRFGVMFFDNPEAAFTNLHRALAPGAPLLFCCWQALKDNPWVWLALQAALQHIPPPPPPQPGEPGPFAFADPDRVRGILAGAGFQDIDIRPQPITLHWGEGETLADQVRELVQIGPVGRLLADQPKDVRETVRESIAEVLAPYYDGDTLVLEGATWFVSARA